MTFYGLQTIDFLERLEKFEKKLPALILELARHLKARIEAVEKPQLEDIEQMQAELRGMIGDPARLEACCGQEGKLCPQCPFGAYLPSGFAYASRRQPLCLPWIVLTQPAAQEQAAAQ